MDGKTAKAMERLLPEEPAKANYLLDRAIPDALETARRTLKAMRKRVKRRIDQGTEALDSSDGAIVRFLHMILKYAAAIALAVFGTLFVLLYALAHLAAVAVAAAPLALACAAVGAAEAIHSRRSGAKGMCPVCKTPYVLPGYRCPSCGQIHYHLKPGCYGILHHTCSCGQKLPCTWFGRGRRADGGSFARTNLEAVCTNPVTPHPVDGSGARSVCVQLAGGRSAGKTAFRNAVVYALTEQLAPAHGIAATCAPDAESLRREVLADYASGEVTMTLEPTDLSVPTATALGVRLHGGGLEPDRIFHMVDIPGEAFAANREHERQLHYAGADGVVLMIDPMSIPAVGDTRRRRLGMVDAAGVGNEDPDRALSALVAKMQDAAGAPARGKLDVPLAIVLGKIDQTGLLTLFDDNAVRDLTARDPALSPDSAHDALVRAFLADNGMGNFLNTVEARFATARYFACSAIGHARGTGPYAPHGTLRPLAWILAQSDPALCHALGLDTASGSDTR